MEIWTKNINKQKKILHSCIKHPSIYSTLIYQSWLPQIIHLLTNKILIKVLIRILCWPISYIHIIFFNSSFSFILHQNVSCFYGLFYCRSIPKLNAFILRPQCQMWPCPPSIPINTIFICWMYNGFVHAKLFCFVLILSNLNTK